MANPVHDRVASVALARLIIDARASVAIGTMDEADLIEMSRGADPVLAQVATIALEFTDATMSRLLDLATDRA